LKIHIYRVTLSSTEPVVAEGVSGEQHPIQGSAFAKKVELDLSNGSTMQCLQIMEGSIRNPTPTNIFISPVNGCQIEPYRTIWDKS